MSLKQYSVSLMNANCVNPRILLFALITRNSETSINLNSSIHSFIHPINPYGDPLNAKHNEKAGDSRLKAPGFLAQSSSSSRQDGFIAPCRGGSPGEGKPRFSHGT